MRIIVVISRLCYGGAEHVGVMLANGLARHGNEVIIASNSHEKISYPVDERVGFYGVFPVTRNKLKKWAGATINLRKLIKREQTDVVVGIAETCSLIAKVACLGMRIPVVYTAHNSFERPSSAPMSKWNRFAKFKLGRMYSCVTVLTEADKSYIGKRLERVSVMPNPLELSPVKVIPDKERVIFAAGRLDAWHVKGFDVLIKAFSKLVQGSRFKVQGSLKPSSEELIVNSEGWKLQIAGTGSEESLNYLKGLCKENGVEDSVEFLGFQKDIEELYQKASIFVLSSRYEGFGLVLIEAMSQGCACIACDYKGRQKEILCPDGQVSGSKFKVQSSSFPTEGSGAAEPETRNSKHETWDSELGSRNSHVELCETGILCEPDDVDALTEAMRKMMMDDDYRESVRMKAVERSEFYSLENTSRRWEELLEKVVKKG